MPMDSMILKMVETFKKWRAVSIMSERYSKRGRSEIAAGATVYTCSVMMHV